MTTIFAFLVSFLISITPPSTFDCDGEPLVAVIRNNLNGDFSVVNDLEKINPGAFVVLEWGENSLMLPLSSQKGEISFTDKKWLWSYQDQKKGLHEDNPRFAKRLPNGEIAEHECNASTTS